MPCHSPAAVSTDFDSSAWPDGYNDDFNLALDRAYGHGRGVGLLEVLIVDNDGVR